MQQLGWATCQRLSPNPDTLFYKFSNDVPVHRLFLDLQCDERSTPTHPVPSVRHASSRYTDSISQVIYFFESHTYPATRIVPPPRVLWSVELHQDNQARFVIPIYYVLTDQGGELSCTMEGFFLFFEFTFFKELFSGALRRSSRIYVYCLLKLKSTYPHWTYLFVCLVCLGVVLLFLVGNKWSSSTPSYISNSVNKGRSICVNQSDRAYNRRGEFILRASRRSVIGRVGT